MAVLWWWTSSLAIVVLASTIRGTESSAIPRNGLPENRRIIMNLDEIRNMTSDQPRERFIIPQHDCNLRVYDADKEADVIRAWHDLVKDSIDEQTAMRQLLIEACDDEEKDLRVMCETFLYARYADLCVPGLTKAECVAVTMYTAEHNGFYRVFNEASANGNWTSYKVYTSLLFSAVKKLAAIEPIPVDARLYRGMRVSCNAPNAERIFWKTFTSTSLDEEIAGYFGTNTFYEFEPKATIFGAKIGNLSVISGEEEVLIPPFEVFNFVRAEGQKFYFSSAVKQELLHGHAADHFRSAQTLSMLTAVISSAIVALRL